MNLKNGIESYPLLLLLTKMMHIRWKTSEEWCYGKSGTTTTTTILSTETCVFTCCGFKGENNRNRKCETPVAPSNVIWIVPCSHASAASPESIRASETTTWKPKLIEDFQRKNVVSKKWIHKNHESLGLEEATCKLVTMILCCAFFWSLRRKPGISSSMFFSPMQVDLWRECCLIARSMSIEETAMLTVSQAAVTWCIDFPLLFAEEATARACSPYTAA